MARTAVIIVAGGSSTRCPGPRPKQFALLGGEPVLARTINLFARALPGAQIVVVLPADHTEFWANLAARFEVAKHQVALGGQTRFHSVQNGLAIVRDDAELVAVQDAVRPLATEAMIRRVEVAAAEHGAAIPVIEAVDSLRMVNAQGSQIIDRTMLRIVQTPQIFRADTLREAYRAPYDLRFTDDASVVEAAGQLIYLAAGEASNLKITRPEELIIAEALLAAREEQQEDGEHL